MEGEDEAPDVLHPRGRHDGHGRDGEWGTWSHPVPSCVVPITAQWHTVLFFGGDTMGTHPWDGRGQGVAGDP